MDKWEALIGGIVCVLVALGRVLKKRKKRDLPAEEVEEEPLPKREEEMV